MKILHVIRGLANSSGTTHIVCPLSEEQARIGHEVTVFHVRKGTEEPVVPDTTLVTNECFPLSVALSNPGISKPLAAALQSRISDFDIVHVHAVWNFPTYWAMRCAAKASVPYIVSPQGSLEPAALKMNRWRKGIYCRLAEYPLFNKAAAMQALTRNEARQIRKYGIKAPVAVLPNGVRLETFDAIPRPRPIRKELALPADARILLYLARIHRKKGLDNLIPAIRHLRAAMPSLHLVVAGHDAGSGYQKDMQELARSQGVAGRVHFVGEVRGEEKVRTLLGADAYVLSSYTEGLPVSVIEAMGAGLPVLVTPGCNIPEVSEAHAGLIVEPDPRAVADGIRSLFDSDPCRLQMGMNARRLVEQRFTWDRIARKSTRVYEKILGTSGSTSKSESLPDVEEIAP